MLGDGPFFESSVEAPTSLPISVAAGESDVYLLFGDDLESVARFDRGGHFLSNYRRPGQGPGEMSFPLGLQLSAGHLNVFDNGAARRLRFSPELELLGEHPLNLPRHDRAALELSNGEIVVTRRAGGVGLDDYLHHIHGPDGALVRSFGEPKDEEPRRLISLDSAGYLWSMHPDRAFIEKFDTDSGAVLQAFDITLSWLPEVRQERDGQEGPPSRIPPDASVVDLQVDDSGLIWVLGYVPDDDWADAETGDYGRRFDGVISVIDPTTKEVMVNLRS